MCNLKDGAMNLHKTEIDWWAKKKNNLWPQKGKGVWEKNQESGINM